MFNNESLGLEFYSNPYTIQQRILEDHFRRLDYKECISDPNNTFNYAMEAFANMTADVVTSMEHALNGGVYPRRADNSEDLYKHISDYDYIGMYSLPAALNITIGLDKDYLIRNALPFNNNYNKVTIPKHTIFNIGPLKFSLYYPIDIMINKATSLITTTWDTSVANPLFTLHTNSLLSVEHTYKRLNLLSIQIPVHNFERTTIRESISGDIGFNATYEYPDKFYALRAFTSWDGEHWHETKYTLGDSNYDPSTPTVVLKVIKEKNKLKVHIPQIYFTNDLIGEHIELVIYTTKGKLNTSIKDIDSKSIAASFEFDNRYTTKYSHILKNIPMITIHPSTNEVIGGTDGYSFEELRKYVVNNTLHTQVPVTPIAIKNHFNKLGYTIDKVYDNLTKRTYLAYNTLRDTDNTILPVINTTILLNEKVVDECDTLIKNIDGSVTILPSTIYNYNSTRNMSVPLTTDERTAFLSLNKREKADKLNTSIYTKYVFHTRVIRDTRYPKAESFNLMSSHTKYLFFEYDNPTMSDQMVVVSHALIHTEDGVGGYTLRLGIHKSKGLEGVDESNIAVIITTSSSTGGKLHKVLEYKGEHKGISIYETPLMTNYYLDSDNNLCITNLQDSAGNTLDYMVKLDHAIYISALIKEYTPNVLGLEHCHAIEYDIPDSHTNYVGMTRQKLTLHFGYALGDCILNDVEAIWTSEKYKKYDDDIIYQYEEDHYKRDSHGAIDYKIKDNKVVLTKLHSKGDKVYKENGQAVIKHHKNEIMRDQFGHNVIDRDRQVEYLINMTQFDLKYFYSDDIEHVQFVELLPKVLEDHSVIVSNENNNLIENTRVYYRPNNTIGNCYFGLGNENEAILPLELSFRFTIYVQDYVYDNPTTLDTIRNTSIEVIEEALKDTVISMVDICNTIKSKLNTYIESIDVEGINGIDTQTLINNSPSSKPNIKQLLVMDGSLLKLKKDIEINYVLV